MINGTREVIIKFEDGDIFVSPPKIKVRRGQTIRWVFEGGAFTVKFDALSPVGAVGFRRGAGGEVSGVVRETAQTGTYKYTVAAQVGGEIYIEDPQVVIEDA
ncbi:MAG: hypothetical protein SFV54_10250 [Bryobacteraceae bacterium]|nr:hypothetical protein [Bryobacteraceae bacterium]